MVTGLLAIGALLKENSPRKIAKLYFINCKHIQSTFFTHPEEHCTQKHSIANEQ